MGIEVENSDSILVDVREACRLLAVSRSTLFKLTSNGAIRFVKIGKAVRFRRSDLSMFVDALAGA